MSVRWGGRAPVRMISEKIGHPNFLRLCTWILPRLSELALAHGRSHCALVNAASYSDEKKQLQKGCVVVTATPGRLLHHLQNTEDWDYENIELLVIDEVEHVINRGHLDEIDEIMRLFRSKPKQVVLVSVKVTDEIEAFTLRFSHIAQFKKFCVSKRTRLPPSIIGRYWKKVLVFMASNAIVKFYQLILSGVFNLHGMQLRGEMDTREKTRVFFRFRKSKVKFLLATDVASFGLDMPELDVVVHFDVPRNNSDYVEKTGRCGRAGAPGESVIFLQHCEMEMVEYLKNESQIVLEEIIVPIDVTHMKRIVDYVESLEEAKTMALKLYEMIILQYSAHPLKDVCNIGNLVFSHVALSLGLLSRPDVFIKCGSLRDSRSKKRKLKININEPIDNPKVIRFEDSD
ncbi:hypothetical protein ACOME3_005955 [Neoechinorhynchus agilis]